MISLPWNRGEEPAPIPALPAPRAPEPYLCGHCKHEAPDGMHDREKGCGVATQNYGLGAMQTLCQCKQYRPLLVHDDWERDLVEHVLACERNWRLEDRLRLG